MKKVFNWFLQKYLEIVFFLDKKKLEKALDREFQITSMGGMYQIYQNDTERKYAEGIALVKNKVNSAVKSKSKEEYERVLKEISDLIILSNEETPSQRALRKALEKLYAPKEKSKKAMIRDRIQHYEELREYNQERTLIKKIKQARKDNNIELAEKLELEWMTLYGKTGKFR